MFWQPLLLVLTILISAATCQLPQLQPVRDAAVEQGAAVDASATEPSEALLTVNINLGNGQQVPFELKRGEDPHAAAAAFGIKYGLAEAQVQKISAYAAQHRPADPALPKDASEQADPGSWGVQPLHQINKQQLASQRDRVRESLDTSRKAATHNHPLQPQLQKTQQGSAAQPEQAPAPIPSPPPMSSTDVEQQSQLDEVFARHVDSASESAKWTKRIVNVEQQVIGLDSRMLTVETNQSFDHSIPATKLEAFNERLEALDRWLSSVDQLVAQAATAESVANSSAATARLAATVELREKRMSAQILELETRLQEAMTAAENAAAVAEAAAAVASEAVAAAATVKMNAESCEARLELAEKSIQNAEPRNTRMESNSDLEAAQEAIRTLERRLEAAEMSIAVVDTHPEPSDNPSTEHLKELERKLGERTVQILGLQSDRFDLELGDLRKRMTEFELVQSRLGSAAMARRGSHRGEGRSEY
eukprot:SAG31_NODE_6487_length_1999_cov_1.584737_1_plen_478_part_00